jgi:hypothetical protein
LSGLTDSYLRLLGQAGVVRGSLLEHAQAARVVWQRPTPPVRAPYPERKWPYFVRARLTETLGVPNLYDLDRWDLSVTTTVDAEAQRHAAFSPFRWAPPIHRSIPFKSIWSARPSMTLRPASVIVTLPRLRSDRSDI